MKVLYLNHTGHVSGAERSLLDLLNHLPGDVEGLLACPADGPLAQRARAGGTRVLPIRGTDGSLKLHPVGTPVAVSDLARAALQTARHARRTGARVLHANSIRSGLVAVAASRLCGRPAVVHLRDRLPRGTTADASLRVIARGAARVVANSRYTAEGLLEVTACPMVVSIPNPIELTRFEPAGADRAAARHALGVAPESLVLAVVGQITPWKGQREAVEALALVRRRHPESRLLLVGEAKFASSATRYDNPTYLRDLRRRIASLGLSETVTLTGEIEDMPMIMSAIDLLLVPSWEEPFGRVVVEGMASGTPVLATTVGGPAEIIHDSVDGILLEPRNPEVWADAIERLALDAPLRDRLGAAARVRSADFSVEEHVARVVEVYRSVI